jgi:prevent-host-death family protein
MRTAASIADVKARLSEFVRRAKAGNEVVITERGVPVARLTGLEMAERRATRRDRLARAGTVKAGRGRVRRELQTPPAGEAVGADVLTALLAERGETS